MKYILILIFLLSASCAKSKTSQADLPETNPAPSSQLSTWCGEDILTYSGFAFEVNLSTGATTFLPDGLYGYDAYTNGWGTPIPACWFKITNGEPGGV